MDKMLERILSLIPKNPDGKFKYGKVKEFADKLNLKNSSTIADWQSGRNKSYRKYVYQIAALYNVSVEWLEGKTDEKNPAPKNENGEVDISEAVKQLVDELDVGQRQALLEYIRLLVKQKEAERRE